METSNWISLGALFLSVGALWVSLAEAMSNKPRLRIFAGRALVHGSMRLSIPADHPLDDGSRTRVLEISVSNYGRQPTIITHLSVLPRNGKGEVALTPHGLNSLPRKLEAGGLERFELPFDVASDDRLNPGESASVFEIIAHGGARILIRDSWHSKPHYVSIT